MFVSLYYIHTYHIYIYIYIYISIYKIYNIYTYYLLYTTFIYNTCFIFYFYNISFFLIIERLHIIYIISILYFCKYDIHRFHTPVEELVSKGHPICRDNLVPLLFVRKQISKASGAGA